MSMRPRQPEAEGGEQRHGFGVQAGGVDPRLAEHGVIVRNIPGRPWLRASVGAWNDEEDLDRLMSALAG